MTYKSQTQASAMNEVDDSYCISHEGPARSIASLDTYAFQKGNTPTYLAGESLTLSEGLTLK